MDTRVANPPAHGAGRWRDPVSKPLLESLSFIILGKHPGMGLEDHIVILCFLVCETTSLFAALATPLTLSRNEADGVEAEGKKLGSLLVLSCRGFSSRI